MNGYTNHLLRMAVEQRKYLERLSELDQLLGDFQSSQNKLRVNDGQWLVPRSFFVVEFSRKCRFVRVFSNGHFKIKCYENVLCAEKPFSCVHEPL